ncbi:MAG: superoxide dismutase family protein [Burkholderiales bacterium]|nr:superoxide dismutase family protein [Burkholderiales bacterium]
MRNSLAVFACAITLVGCTGVNLRSPTANAKLVPTKGSHVSGTVTFTQEGEQVLVEARITGLSPGLHGFHVHERGNCTAPDASSAGPHFNPHSAAHGGPESERRHAGDLGNIEAGADGVAVLRRQVTGISLGTDVDSIIGRAVIVHERPDDLASQPAGDAGTRLACGLVSKSADKWF